MIIHCRFSSFPGADKVLADRITSCARRLLCFRYDRTGGFLRVSVIHGFSLLRILPCLLFYRENAVNLVSETAGVEGKGGVTIEHRDVSVHVCALFVISCSTVDGLSKRARAVPTQLIHLTAQGGSDSDDRRAAEPHPVKLANTYLDALRTPVSDNGYAVRNGMHGRQTFLPSVPRVVHHCRSPTSSGCVGLYRG